MDDDELADGCLHAAVGLIRGGIESETWAGPLHLNPGGNGTWDVYQPSLSTRSIRR